MRFLLAFHSNEMSNPKLKMACNISEWRNLEFRECSCKLIHWEIFSCHQSLMTQRTSSYRCLDKIWANRNICFWDTDQLSTADVPGPVIFPCNTTVHWSSRTQWHSFHQTLTSHELQGDNPKSSYSNIITSSFQAIKMVGFLGSDSIQTSLTATNSDCSAFIPLVSWSENTDSQRLVH